MNWTAPAELLKSETRFDDKKIHILIKASDETLDQENDNILAEAFTPEVREFMLSKGVIDFDHMTVRGANALEKATAVIGTPTEFFQELVKGAPVQFIRGYLHRGNPFVDSTLAPALEAGSDRWGASIGGKILNWLKNSNGGKMAKSIWMNHVAITPAYKAVNKNTAVEILKSKDLNEADVEIHHFGSLGSLLKALEAGSATDSAQMTGAQAVQRQSLEGGKPVSLTIPRDVIAALMSDLVEGVCEYSEKQIGARASIYGLNPESTKKVVSLLLHSAVKDKVMGLMRKKRSLLLQR